MNNMKGKSKSSKKSSIPINIKVSIQHINKKPASLTDYFRPGKSNHSLEDRRTKRDEKDAADNLKMLDNIQTEVIKSLGSETMSIGIDTDFYTQLLSKNKENILKDKKGHVSKHGIEIRQSESFPKKDKRSE